MLPLRPISIISCVSCVSFLIVTVSISVSVSVQAWAPTIPRSTSTSPINIGIGIDLQRHSSIHHDYHHSKTTQLHLFKTEDKTVENEPVDVEETTEAYGLEAGLFQSLKQKDGGQSAKDLLAKYGVAYLATSIPLAIVSFAICYILVDSGVNVAGLLGNVGITVNENSEKVGTFAIAYAAHKAASPIRFPPTVLLTPVVAKLIGKEPAEVEVEMEDSA